MIPVAQAKQLVLARTEALSPLATALDDGLGLVLAEDLVSNFESPPHDKSLVDGYAVRTQDLRQGLRELPIGEEIVAGQVPRQPLSAGTAAAIMTGAPCRRTPMRSSCGSRPALVHRLVLFACWPNMCNPSKISCDERRCGTVANRC